LSKKNAFFCKKINIYFSQFYRFFPFFLEFTPLENLTTNNNIAKKRKFLTGFIEVKNTFDAGHRPVKSSVFS